MLQPMKADAVRAAFDAAPLGSQVVCKWRDRGESVWSTWTGEFVSTHRFEEETYYVLVYNYNYNSTQQLNSTQLNSTQLNSTQLQLNRQGGRNKGIGEVRLPTTLIHRCHDRVGATFCSGDRDRMAHGVFRRMVLERLDALDDCVDVLFRFVSEGAPCVHHKGNEHAVLFCCRRCVFCTFFFFTIREVRIRV